MYTRFTCPPSVVDGAHYVKVLDNPSEKKSVFRFSAVVIIFVMIHEPRNAVLAADMAICRSASLHEILEVES